MKARWRAAWRGAVLAALLAAANIHLSGQPDPAASAAWPGLWGPHRDARVAGPLRFEPGMRLKEIWRRPIGLGVSEVAIASGRGYTMFSDGEHDYLTAFEVGNGKEIWRTRMGATYRGHDGSGDGPISTPVADGGRIFALDPWGKLFAFDAATGRQLWRRDLQLDLGAVPPFWGFATTPLPVGNTLVVQAGGAERNNLVALDPATGRTVWSSQPAAKNGYSSPVLMTLAGVPQIVAATADKVFAVKPEGGSLLWSHPALGEARQSPVPLPGDRLFLTSWDESAVWKLSPEEAGWKVQELWRKPVLKANYSPTVYYQGYLYGMSGIFLTCVDPATGETKWRERVYYASLILVDGLLAVIGERSGDFHLVAATPEGFREQLKVRVFNPGARSITGPMFAGGRFLLRNGEEMVLLEPARPEARPAAERKGE
jgi:outer membrane protein assembly factor BamB